MLNTEWQRKKEILILAEKRETARGEERVEEQHFHDGRF